MLSVVKKGNVGEVPNVLREVPQKDGPPTADVLKQFAGTHYRKLMVIGIVAIVAGLVLMAADFLSGGLSLPFTLELEAFLLSTGVCALVIGLFGLILTDGDRATGDGEEGKKPKQPKVKPTGKRASSGYLLRGLALKRDMVGT